MNKAQIVGNNIWRNSPNAVYFNLKTKTLLFDASNKHVFVFNTLHTVKPISFPSNAIHYVKFEYPVPQILRDAIIGIFNVWGNQLC